MKYNVRITDNVLKYLEKLSKDIKEKVLDRIDELEENPKRGRLLDKSGMVDLRELKYGSFRIYFTIENKFVVINDIEYEGEVEVSEIGKKNDQKRKINIMKDRMYDKSGKKG